MKNTTIFILYITVPFIALSQVKQADTNENKLKSQQTEIKHLPVYKNGFTINCETFVNFSLLLTYSHKLSNKSYFEIGVSGRLSYSEGIYSGLQSYFSETSKRDPYYRYNLLSIRAGYKQYFLNHLYIEPMIKYGYGYYDRSQIVYVKGTCYDISRVRNNLEISAKMGITYQYNHFLVDFYWGIGINAKYYNDMVYERLTHDGGDEYKTNNDLDKTYPYKWNHFGCSFPVLLGLQLGYCF